MIRLEPIAPLHAAVVSVVLKLSFAEGWDEATVAELLALPTTFGWLALEGEEPVGVILLQAAADQAEVLTLATRPYFRRQGVAKALLDQALKAGRSELFLEVAVDNAAALELYQSHGFKEVGRRKGYYQTGDARTDAAVLKWMPY